MEGSGIILSIAAGTSGPYLVALLLAGRKARHDLIAINLLLAALAGALLAFISSLIAVLVIGSLIGKNGTGLGWFDTAIYAAFWAILAVLPPMWLGSVGGMAYVLLRLHRRRAASIVLFSALALWLITAAVCGSLAHSGVSWARGWPEASGPQYALVLVAIPLPWAVWFLLTQHRRCVAGP